MRIKTLVLSAILIAVGIIIPLFSPIRILIEPASFTLASHVAIFIGMFISPSVGVAVALGTTFGFFLSTPLVVALRAFSHVIFVLIGGILLKKNPKLIDNVMFVIGISIIHALAEVVVVSFFYFGGNSSGFVTSVLGLVGLGTFVHSIVDYYLAYFVAKRLGAAGYEKLFQ